MIGLAAAVLGFSLRIECDPKMTPEECSEVSNACARVRQRGGCSEGDDRQGEEPKRATIDLESPDIASLRIDGKSDADAIRRVLRFRPEDSKLERAKAMGLTLGVLAESLEPEEKETPPRAEPPNPRPEDSAKESQHEPSPPRLAETKREEPVSAASPVFEVGLVSRYEPGLATPFFGGRAGVLFREDRTLGFGIVGNLTHSFRAPSTLGVLEASTFATLVVHPSKTFPVSPALGLGVSFLDAGVADFGYHVSRTTFTSELSLRAKVASFDGFSLLLVPHVGLTPVPTTFSRGDAVVARLDPFFFGIHVSGTWSPDAR